MSKLSELCDKKIFLIFIFLISNFISNACVDSTFTLKIDSSLLKTDSSKLLKIDSSKIAKVDTTKAKPIIKKHDPRIATKRSLMLPGWGQAYNKEYWKIPLVWGALSIPTVTFFYNHGVYKESRFAYDARFKAAVPNATKADSADFYSLEPKYKTADINAIQSLRNAARRDRDYSVFWFLIVWGLNVADATVFGHLKDFDVSPNLSMRVRPDYNPFTKTTGLNLNFKFKEKKKEVFVGAR